MPISDRAKQFMPFASLRGYGAAVREKQRVICPKRELSEEELTALSDTILTVKKGDIIKIVYYNNGGYTEIEGMVSRIDLILKRITVIKTEIYFSDISEIILTD